MGQGVLTPGFVGAPDGALACEGVSIERVAREVGTPCYVYSAAIIRDRYTRLSAALSAVPHRIHYTLKANSSRAVLRMLRDLGAGAEIVSGGELHRALAAGFTGKDIIFGGVGKTEDELDEALRAKVSLINVESLAELDCQRQADISEADHCYVPVPIAHPLSILENTTACGCGG